MEVLSQSSRNITSLVLANIVQCFPDYKLTMNISQPPELEGQYLRRMIEISVSYHPDIIHIVCIQ